MRPEPREEERRWLDQARRDLDDARYARDGSRYNLSCFMCQHAAEKALKGLIVLHERDAPWGHSVGDLCARATAHDPAFGELRPIGAKLDLLYIPTRYPNGLPGGLPADAFDASDCERALDNAQRIVSAVDRAFEPPQSGS